MDVYKIGGTESDNKDFLTQFALQLKKQNSKNPCVIVHGGGRKISELCVSIGLPVSFIDGMRVTCSKTIPFVDMVLGHVGSQVARSLQRADLPSVSLRGCEGIFKGELHANHAQLGHVGTVTEVNPDLVQTVLEAGFIPVITPLGCDSQGNLLNINADHAAVALAVALNARQLMFISSVEGVLHSGQALNSLTQPESHKLKSEGIICDGMIPKVDSAFKAKANGVEIVKIMGLGKGNTGFSSGTLIL